MSNAPAASTPSAHHRPHVKETLISIIIAFALAFVFRGFVIEAFLIPTGSMAPTLMGAHLRITDPKTGYSWPVSAPDFYPDASSTLPLQGGQRIPNRQDPSPAIQVTDPMTRLPMPAMRNVPRRAGDRIFVMKYLASIYDPQRFDVVVFKNPTDPQVNFIKRLVGMPGTMTALIDGDVFWRTAQASDPPGVNPWTLPGWQVASKPERAQRTMWQPVSDSDYEPRGAAGGAYRRPWLASEGWSFTDRSYDFTGSGAAALRWDPQVSIRDDGAYNETMRGSGGSFPVSDLRVELTIEPKADGVVVSPIIAARGHEFRADFEGERVSVKVRSAPITPGVPAGEWREVSTGALRRAMKAGRATRLELWHVDQGLQVFQEDEAITARYEYAWTPGQRLMNATNLGEGWASATWEQSPRGDDLLTQAGRYLAPSVRIECTGGAFSIHRVALSRDIYYQPALYNMGGAGGGPHSKHGQPALATHPRSTLTLTKDEFFCIGDNSPSSLDGRLWDEPDPWVRVIDERMGVVHRDLLIGKAFFVYFPAANWRGMLPVPDFGRMRWIW